MLMAKGAPPALGASPMASLPPYKGSCLPQGAPCPVGSRPARVLALVWGSRARVRCSPGTGRGDLGPEGSGLGSDGATVPSRPREVLPLLQRAHGPPLRLPERPRLHRLVQGPPPHTLHRHPGRLREDHALRGHQVPVERPPPDAGDGSAGHRHLLHRLRPAPGLPARSHREPRPPHPLAGGGPRSPGCCDGDQPPGADPHQDAVAAAQLPGAARLHPVGGGSGRLAVPLEGLGTHRAAGRPLLRSLLVQLRAGARVAVRPSPAG